MRHLCDGKSILVMDERSAELTSTHQTRFLQRNFFMTKLQIYSERVRADVDIVRRGVGSDLFGPQFLFPGVGCGSCFPNVIAALVHTSLSADMILKI